MRVTIKATLAVLLGLAPHAACSRSEEELQVEDVFLEELGGEAPAGWASLEEGAPEEVVLEGGELLAEASAHALAAVPSSSGSSVRRLLADARRLFRPLPPAVDAHENRLTEAKVQLGRMLFFDRRLSRDRDLSCSSCHPLEHYGSDGCGVSLGHRKRRGQRNTPTVLNAAVQRFLFWDGRSRSVEEQVAWPMLGTREMAMPSRAAVEAMLRSIPSYVAAFRAAFPHAEEPVVRFERVTEAIGAFERALVTPSRWDRFLMGDEQALTEEEQEGLRLFLDLGCSSCHSGTGVGGDKLRQLGSTIPWGDASDHGRYDLTHDPADWMVFKVAALRNVAETAPYGHSGRVATLEEQVRLMARHQLGHELAPSAVRRLVAWLRVLTGELPRALVEPPAMPLDPMGGGPPSSR